MKYAMIAGVAIVCYFIGNINFALIISKILRRDVRKEGSGNPGAMNMFRNFGTFFGALTLLLDAFKGAFSALLGWFVLGNFSFNGSKLGLYIGGFCVILGHIYPVLLKFKGGKGIASSIGVCFVLNPMITLISLLCGIIFIIITKMGSITSFIIISFPLALTCYEVANSLTGTEKLVSLLLMIGIYVLTLWAHRANLKKLFLGKENKTKIFSRFKSKT